MIFELVFTSVPKGLKPGSRGFATVAYTDEMPANYVQLCESLSGYVHVFGPQEPNYSLNPTVYSHLITTLGGKDFSVLSRIASYGTDYTGRTNKLAHHILIGVDERVSAGPAVVMSGRDLFLQSWEKEKKPDYLRPNRIRLPRTRVENLKASSWKKSALGDEGVAGVLAQSFLDAPERPSFIIFRPGMDMLPLVAEAQALLPDNRRWDVTFSTYFTALPVGMKCAWRCCLPDSEALTVARRTPNALIIDLVKATVNVPVAGTLVEVAQTGRRPITADEVKSSQTTEVAPPVPDTAKPASQRPVTKRNVRAVGPRDYGEVLAPRPPPSRKPALSRTAVIIAVSVIAVLCVGAIIWILPRSGAASRTIPSERMAVQTGDTAKADVISDSPVQLGIALTSSVLAVNNPAPTTITSMQDDATGSVDKQTVAVPKRMMLAKVDGDSFDIPEGSSIQFYGPNGQPLSVVEKTRTGTEPRTIFVKEDGGEQLAELIEIGLKRQRLSVWDMDEVRMIKVESDTESWLDVRQPLKMTGKFDEDRNFVIDCGVPVDGHIVSKYLRPICGSLIGQAETLYKGLVYTSICEVSCSDELQKKDLVLTLVEKKSGGLKSELHRWESELTNISRRINVGSNALNNIKEKLQAVSNVSERVKLDKLSVESNKTAAATALATYRAEVRGLQKTLEAIQDDTKTRVALAAWSNAHDSNLKKLAENLADADKDIRMAHLALTSIAEQQVLALENRNGEDIVAREELQWATDSMRNAVSTFVISDDDGIRIIEARIP